MSLMLLRRSEYGRLAFTGTYKEGEWSADSHVDQMEVSHTARTLSVAALGSCNNQTPLEFFTRILLGERDGTTRELMRIPSGFHTSVGD